VYHCWVVWELWLWSRYSSWMAARSYVSGFSWCRKLFCTVSDLFMFCCQIMRRFLLSLLALVSVGCVMVPCWLEGPGCCHLWSSEGILLVCAVCWVLRFLLGLVLCLVQWFLPCRFSWAQPLSLGLLSPVGWVCECSLAHMSVLSGYGLGRAHMLAGLGSS